ncbi:hypothetical protein PRIPAC_95873, partial [Pristionchus pacificus]|uniref:G protein-coupled receptor n=1 Tax=Pristionchus pacificus TaxID=54126 RepID=A0A2A6B348_PRIPA
NSLFPCFISPSAARPTSSWSRAASVADCTESSGLSNGAPWRFQEQQCYAISGHPIIILDDEVMLRPSMLTTMDKLHTFVLCTLDLSAILANCVLVYAILTSTRRTLRSYAILLLNTAIVDVISASCSALAIARLIYLPEGPSQLYLYVGPCSAIGLSFCHLCHTIHTFFVTQSTLVLLHSFCFRLYIISDKLVHVKVPTVKATVLISILLYGPIGFVILDYPATWHRDVTDYRFSVSLTILILLSPAAMVIIFLVRRILLGEIRKMESRARDHHSHIAVALTYQLLLPVGQALACFTWLLSVGGLWSGEASERLVMTFGSFLAVGSPLINLTFLPPYRRMFGSRHRRTKTIGKTCFHRSYKWDKWPQSHLALSNGVTFIHHHSLLPFLLLPWMRLPLLLALLVVPFVSAQSSHDESLKAILCASLICDLPKECEIYEGIPQCRLPPSTTPQPTIASTFPTLPTILWSTPPPLPSFPAFTFPTPPSPPPPPTASTAASPTTPSVCSLPPDTGPCTRARIMWYFDVDSQSCQRFSFSGCGNGNRFSSRYQCELRCLREKEDAKSSSDNA